MCIHLPRDVNKEGKQGRNYSDDAATAVIAQLIRVLAGRFWRSAPSDSLRERHCACVTRSADSIAGLAERIVRSGADRKKWTAKTLITLPASGAPLRNLVEPCNTIFRIPRAFTVDTNIGVSFVEIPWTYVFKICSLQRQASWLSTS